MAGTNDNPLLKEHEFKFDDKVEVCRGFPSRESARAVAIRVRRAGFDCKTVGATLVLSVPSTLALSVKVFGEFS